MSTLTASPVRRVVLGTGVVATLAVVTVAVAALTAAFTGAAAPFVIGDPGPAVRWGLIVMHSVTNVAAALTIGTLLLASVALPVTPVPGRAPRAHRPALSLVAGSATVWAVGSVVLLVLTYADVLGTPLGEGPDVLSQLSSYAWYVPAGQGLLFTAAGTALVGLAAAGVVTLRSTALLALASLAALVPAALAGHAASSGDHDTAVTAIGLHLLGVTAWLGGLVALLALAPALAPAAMTTTARRYSTLAGWAFATVAASGVLSSWLQLPGWGDLFGSRYGLVIVLKTVALVALGAAGWWHRRTTLRALDGGLRGAFARLAVVEVVVMAVALGLGAALAQSAPPTAASTGPVEQLTVTGYPLPPELTFTRMLTGWQPDLLWLVVAGLAAAGYLVAITRLRRRGDAWPVLRTLPFLLGLLLLVYVTSGGPAVYGRVMFSTHMLGHMLISMVVPALLVLGAPATLALRVLGARPDGSRGPREWLLAVLHSPVVRVLSFAPVAAAIFVGSLIAFYYTPLFGVALRTHVGHELMYVHFLLAGYLFANVLVGVDPGPARPGYPLRVVLLFATMGFHAFFGTALLQGTTVLQQDFFAAVARPWGRGLLADQQYGGGLAWGLGEIPTLMLVLVLIVQWSRSDDREARRVDRAADRDGDAELTAYNDMLAKLADRDARPSR